MSKIKQNLELILNIKGILNRIESLEDKASIAGKVGQATQAIPGGDNVSTSAGGAASGAGGGVSGAGDSKAGAIDGANSSGSVQSGTDAFDNPLLNKVLDQLTDIFDCDTGQELKLNTSGKDTQNTNTAWQGWDEGVFWEVSGTYITTGNYSAIEKGVASSVGYFHPSFHYTVRDYRGFTTNFNSGNLRGGTFEAYLDWADTGTPINTGWGLGSWEATSTDCTSQGVELCPSTAPKKGTFLTGQPTELTWKGGRWQPNSEQTDVPSKYKGGMQSTVDFCFGDDMSRHGRVEPGKDGGLLMYETDDGVINQPGKYYDANGKLMSIFDKDHLSLYQAS